MVDVTSVTGFIVLELAAADDWPATPPGPLLEIEAAPAQAPVPVTQP
jgi:hypothetical protein